MVLVSRDLVYYHLHSSKLRSIFELLESDSEVQTLLSILQEKIETSEIEDKVEVVAYVNGQELKRLRFDHAIIV